MKAYYYTYPEMGLETPRAQLHLDNTVEEVRDPAQADVFVIPSPLCELGWREGVLRLPYLKGNERRHVAMNFSENADVYLDLPAPILVFRYDCTTDTLKRDPRTIALPYPCPDLKELAGPPPGGFKYDVTFRGALNQPSGVAALASVQRQPGLRLDVERHGMWVQVLQTDPAQAARMQVEFHHGLRYSRLSLSPENYPGVHRSRFYEALSAGRVPVLVGDRHVNGFAPLVDYRRCSLAIATADAGDTGAILSEWLRTHTDEEIDEMGAYAREAWEKYLDREVWAKTITTLVRQEMGL